MNKAQKTYIWFLLLIALATSIYFISTQLSSTLDNSEPCVKEGNTCYYKDIPKGLEGYILDATTKIDYENLSSFMSGHWGSYVCNNTQEAPIEKRILSGSNCSPELYGCGFWRNAIICGNQYFIENGSSSTGPSFYGPFELE